MLRISKNNMTKLCYDYYNVIVYISNKYFFQIYSYNFPIYPLFIMIIKPHYGIKCWYILYENPKSKFNLINDTQNLIIIESNNTPLNFEN